MSSSFGTRVAHKKGSLRDTLHKRAEATLTKEGIFNAVVCPEDVDRNEWIAVHAVDFYNDICMLFGIIADDCTPEKCPNMSAGSKFEYLWLDKEHYRAPTRFPAKIYIDYLLNWLLSQLDDPKIFPVDENTPFPPNYDDYVKIFFRRIFRVYGHIWHNHHEFLKLCKCESFFIFSLTHYLYFVDHFNLIDGKEIRPLNQLVNEIAPGLPLVKAMNAIEESKQGNLKMQLAYQQQLAPVNRPMLNARPSLGLQQRPAPYWPLERPSAEFRSSLCYHDNGEDTPNDETAVEPVQHSPSRYPALVLRSVPPEVVSRSAAQNGGVPAGISQLTESQTQSVQSVQSVQSMQSKASISPVSPGRTVGLGQPMQGVARGPGASSLPPMPRGPIGSQPIYQYAQQGGARSAVPPSPQRYAQQQPAVPPSPQRYAQPSVQSASSAVPPSSQRYAQQQSAVPPSPQRYAQQQPTVPPSPQRYAQQQPNVPPSPQRYAQQSAVPPSPQRYSQQQPTVPPSPQRYSQQQPTVPPSPQRYAQQQPTVPPSPQRYAQQQQQPTVPPSPQRYAQQQPTVQPQQPSPVQPATIQPAPQGYVQQPVQQSAQYYMPQPAPTSDLQVGQSVQSGQSAQTAQGTFSQPSQPTQAYNLMSKGASPSYGTVQYDNPNEEDEEEDQEEGEEGDEKCIIF